LNEERGPDLQVKSTTGDEGQYPLLLRLLHEKFKVLSHLKIKIKNVNVKGFHTTLESLILICSMNWIL